MAATALSPVAWAVMSTNPGGVPSARPARSTARQRLATPGDARRVVAVELERLREELPQLGLVVHHQDACHRCLLAPPRQPDLERRAGALRGHERERAPVPLHDAPRD